MTPSFHTMYMEIFTLSPFALVFTSAIVILNSYLDPPPSEGYVVHDKDISPNLKSTPALEIRPSIKGVRSSEEYSIDKLLNSHSDKSNIFRAVRTLR